MNGRIKLVDVASRHSDLWLRNDIRQRAVAGREKKRSQKLNQSLHNQSVNSFQTFRGKENFLPHDQDHEQELFYLANWR